MVNEKIKRIIEWAKGKRAYPLGIECSLTNACNLKCIFCWQRDEKHNLSNELNTQKWISLIKESSRLGIQRWMITGGEPLCRKNKVISMMQKIKICRMIGSLSTNGTLFNEQDVKKIVKMRWDDIMISLDGSTPQLHDKIRSVKGAFDRTIKTIKLFDYWKRKMKINKPKIILNIALTKDNFLDILNIIQLGTKLGVRDFSIKDIVDENVHSDHAKCLRLNYYQKKYTKKNSKRSMDSKQKTN